MYEGVGVDVRVRTMRFRMRESRTILCGWVKELLNILKVMVIVVER